MLALAKGYTPGLPQLLAVLGITEDVARQSWRDPLASDTGHTSSHDEPEEEYGVREHQQQHVHNVEEEDEMACCWGLVESIRVRQLFGGMTGDMAMLRRYEALWERRFRCRGRLGRRTNDSSQPGEATNPANTPPCIKDGRRKWLQFLFDSYNPQAPAASTTMRQNGNTYIHATTTSTTTDALDSTVLLHNLSGYGSVVTAAICGDSPSHMYAPQQDTDAEGMSTRSTGSSAVLSIGTYVAELGRRCAAVTRASTAGMAAEGRKVAGATLSGLATWLAVKRGDVPPSAIDFHCSNVIDSLLQQTELRAAVLAAHKSSLHPSDWEEADSLDAISGRAKTAMWVCSSSINHKAIIALAESASQGMEGGEPWYGGYYDGDPVPPAQHQRVWAVMMEAATVFQQGVIASRVPHRPR